HHKTMPFEVKAHYNKDLGLAYAEREGRLADDDLERASRPDILVDAGSFEGADLVTMGVDVASRRNLNVRVSRQTEDNRAVPLFNGAGAGFGEGDKLMKRFGVKMACIDPLPETRLAMQLAEKHPGRVFLARFGTHPEIIKVVPELRTVSTRRTESIDAAFQG